MAVHSVPVTIEFDPCITCDDKNVKQVKAAIKRYPLLARAAAAANLVVGPACCGQHLLAENFVLAHVLVRH